MADIDTTNIKKAIELKMRRAARIIQAKWRLLLAMKESIKSTHELNAQVAKEPDEVRKDPLDSILGELDESSKVYSIL